MRVDALPAGGLDVYTRSPGKSSLDLPGTVRYVLFCPLTGEVSLDTTRFVLPEPAENKQRHTADCGKPLANHCATSPGNNLGSSAHERVRELSQPRPARGRSAHTAAGGDTGQSMATVVIRREWPDGDVVAVSIEVDESFPDVVAEARQAAVKAFEDALEVSLAYDADEDE